MAMSPKELRVWVENGADISQCNDAEAYRIRQVLDFISQLRNNKDAPAFSITYGGKTSQVDVSIVIKSLPNSKEFWIKRLQQYPHDIVAALPLYDYLGIAPLALEKKTVTIGDLTLSYEENREIYGKRIS